MINSNGGEDIRKDVVSADNGARVGTATAVQPPDVINSRPPERITEGGSPQDAVKDHTDSESERLRANLKGQQQPLLTAIGIPAQPTKRRSRHTDRKLHPKSAPEPSRRRLKFAASHAKGRFLTPLLARSAAADVRAPSDRDGVGKVETDSAEATKGEARRIIKSEAAKRG